MSASFCWLRACSWARSSTSRYWPPEIWMFSTRIEASAVDMPFTLWVFSTSIHSSSECSRPPAQPVPSVTAGSPRLIGILLSVEEAAVSNV